MTGSSASNPWSHSRRVADTSDETSQCGGQTHLQILKTRMMALAFGGLALLYHAENAWGEVVDGSVTDGIVYVQWEYDLEHGTGQLFVENLALAIDLEDDEMLFLVGLIPAAATNIQYAPQVVSLDPCTMSAVPNILPYLFAALPPQTATTLTYQFPAQGQELSVGSVHYGAGYLLSAAHCHTLPRTRLDNFVAVQPIQVYAAADLDRDGDVDLQDFGTFVDQFTGPQQP